MASKRPNEPIGPATIPGERVDPKIPPEQAPEPDEHVESDEERQARESEKAFDEAITRIPPG
jgi:hypothetical protein